NSSSVDFGITAKDAFDNPVPDGTPVAWSLEGLGRIQQADNATANGQASATLAAGFQVDDQILSAQVDALEVPIAVPNTPLNIALSWRGGNNLCSDTAGEIKLPTRVNISLRVTDANNVPVADGTAVTWFTSIGKLGKGSGMANIYTESITNGLSYMTLD